MVKIWWISKIEIWSEELGDGHQTVPYQPEALFWGSQLSGNVSNPFKYHFKFHSYLRVPLP